MIANKRIVISADSIINEVTIATHSAVITTNDKKMYMTSQYLDKDACNNNLDAVKADQQTFEDYVHSYYVDESLYN